MHQSRKEKRDTFARECTHDYAMLCRRVFPYHFFSLISLQNITALFRCRLSVLKSHFQMQLKICVYDNDDKLKAITLD